MPPRALLLAAMLLPLGGCLAPSCEGCARAWQAEGTDAAFFAALEAAPGANRTPERGVPLPDPNLTAAWGPRYALASATLLADRNGTAEASLLLDSGPPRVRLVTPEGWNGTQALGLLRALLANASPGDAAREKRLLDALLANRTAYGPGRVERVALLDGEAQVAALWARLGPTRLRGGEDHYLSHGDPVAKGSWRFAFTFPVARVEAGEVRAAANARGAYTLLLLSTRDLDAAGAEAALRVALAEAGVGTFPADLRVVRAA